MSQKLEIKPSQAFYNFAKEVAQLEADKENNPLQEELWKKMGTELEIAGFPPNKISVIMQKQIEDDLYELRFKDDVPREEYRWHSGHYYTVVKKNGWSGNYTPFSPVQDSYINTQRKELVIANLQMTNEICSELIKKINSYPKILSLFESKEFSEYMFQWESILKIDKDAIDEKTKVPSNTIHILLDCLASEASVNLATKLFMTLRLKNMEAIQKFLTAKQSGKFQHGEIEGMPRILLPKNRDMAIFMRYNGQQCSSCGAYNMKEFFDGIKTKLKCVSCKNIEDETTIVKCPCCQKFLFKENLQHIVQTNKCDDCNTEIILPEELIEYANS